MDNLDREKNILVIGTGGTIAGVGDKGKTLGYDSAQINVDNILSGVPYIEDLANVKPVELYNVDSSDMSIDKLVNMACYIEEMAARDDVDGFVITHGTDTLEETAYFLNLTVHTHKPIVLTGAMRPSTAISADGPFNLYQAVALARSSEAEGKGVLVVFADAIYGGRDVIKVNTFKTDAFNQKDMGSFGYMRDDKAYFYNHSVKKHTLSSEFRVSKDMKLPNVEVVNYYLGRSEDILKHASKISEGIVLGGAGCGGASEKWNKEIEKMLKSGKIVVRSSRISNGLVTHSSKAIFKKGVYSNSLTPQKSRILLMLALTKTKDIEKIQEVFNMY
ncbi:MAG: asparaginase [Clostridia bacterium]|nr:asparaginase [Clostridia bacterium]